jgi:hypothetical protein
VTDNEAVLPLLDEEKLEEVELERDEREAAQGRVKRSHFWLSSSAIPLFSFGVFIFSLLFYIFSSYNAATGRTCQRRMWAYSKSVHMHSSKNSRTKD